MLIDKIRHSIPAELLERGRIAVAFSGGADSLALLLALAEIRKEAPGLSLLALHCNFHLRGQESDSDAAFCAEVCGRLGVELLTRDFHNVREKCSARGESLEMACRRLRYEWFGEFTARGWILAVGHHIEDNRETMLINLLRGTGVKGLGGMEPFDRSGRLLRPMLDATRAEIEDYLVAMGETWRTDSTNAVPDVVRNKLRLEVMPLLNSRFPAAMAGIDKTMGNMRSDYALLRELLGRLVPLVIDAEGTTLHLDRLKGLTSQPARVLLEILGPRGFNYSQCESIAGAETSTESRRYSSGGYILRVVDGRATLSAAEEEEKCGGSEIVAQGIEDLCAAVPGLSLETLDCDNPVDFIASIKKENNPERLYLDADKFDSLNHGAWLTWRPVENGDRMRPIGMRGRSRLVSDILGDAGAHPLFKKQCRVLVDGRGEIVWLAPMRASAHYTVDASTSRIYRLAYESYQPQSIKFWQ